MPTVLSIHLAPTSAHAAVDRDGRIDLVALGEKEAAMPVDLHLGEDGSVAVGPEARRRAGPEPDGLVDDAVGCLLDADEVEAAGRSLGAEAVLAYLLAHVYSRCVAVLDGVPDEVVVVLTAGGPGASVHTAAAERARVGDFSVLEETRARSAMAAHGPGGIRAELAGALGALFWRRYGDSPSGPQPIVTREDLGVVPRQPLRPPTAPSVMSTGRRSVFDEPPVPDPGRRTAGRGAVTAVVAVLVLAGLAALAAFVVPWGGDRGADGPGEVGTAAPSTTEPASTTATPTTDPALTAPATSPPTTTPPPTAAPATTPPPTTTPQAGVVSTTLPPALTTTTLVPPPTTTTTPPPTTSTRPPLGPLTLSPVGIVTNATTDAESLVALGDSAEAVVAALTALLGAPRTDTGWQADEACAGDLARRVTFGELEVVLADADATEGVPGTGATFTQWFATGPDATATSLWSYERIGVGTTVAYLREVYGDGLLLTSPVEDDPAGSFSVEGFGVSAGMRGVTSNTTEIGRVLQVWAGDGCARWPD